MTDKSDLLNQLKIDRTEEPQAKGVSFVTLMAVALISIGLGGYGALQLFAPEPEIIEVPVPAQVQTSMNGPTTSANNVTPVSDKILNASGYITARRMATVSAEVMGLITQVNVEEGMLVTSGQVLAKLDDAVARTNLDYAEAQVRVSEANLGSIRANLAEAKRVLKRATKLNAADFSSEASVTRAQADVESLRASLESAEANVKVMRIEADRQRERFNDHTIRAPFDGVVTVKNAQPGEIVSPSSAGGGFTRTGICTIVDMGSLEIEVDVNEAFIGRVFAGQKVEANLDAYPDWDIPASVIAIIPTADRAKATVRVRIQIDEKDARILPDMGVKVAFLKGDSS